MDKNKYAYLLVGVVLLAGFAGYMISDSAPQEDLSEPQSNSFNLNAEVESSSDESNNMESVSNYGS